MKYMNPFSFLQPTSQFLGAIDDYRTPEHKQKDFRFDEIVATTAPVRFEAKEPSQWRSFPVRSQGQAGSCVAHSCALVAGILQEHRDKTFIEFSASDVYQKRQNRTWPNGSAGMWATDAFEIMRKDGITLEALMPSMNVTEAGIHQIPRKPYYGRVGEVFRIGEYVMFTPGDFDSVASTVQKTRKGVMVWFRFHGNEWTTTPRVRAANPPLHHSVVAIDVAVYGGKRGIVIQDSWGHATGINGRRFITEEFYHARNSFAGYVIAFRTDEDAKPTPVSHTFARDLRYGMTGDKDVQLMQDVLKREGLFPTNIDSTGNYYEITRRAVLAFQHKHNVDTPAQLEALQGRVVGPKTRTVLTRLSK